MYMNLQFGYQKSSLHRNFWIYSSILFYHIVTTFN